MRLLVFKKSAITILALFLALVLVACGGSDESTSSGGGSAINAGESETTDGADEITLRITSWDNQFRYRFEEVVELPDGVNVQWIINEFGPIYTNEVIRMLQNDEIDIFATEIGFTMQFLDTDLVMDVRDLGFTDEHLSNMFEYTLQAATGNDGIIRGVAWEANPGAFIYRRSIAIEVFGTDDPEVIQGYLQDWAAFNLAAERLYDHGHQIVAGPMDPFRTFSNNIANPWVNENDEIIIDPNMMLWVDQSAEFIERGFSRPGVGLWSGEWSQGVNPSDDQTAVFGYFHAPWGINFVMLGQSLDVQEENGGVAELGNGTFGDWAAVAGPEGFFWGGKWIHGASASQHQELIADIMHQMTSNEDNLRTFTNEFSDFVNNRNVVAEIANSDFGSGFLGGQNHIALLAQAVDTIDISWVGAFDERVISVFGASFADYFEGMISREEALDNFFDTVMIYHPNLRRPSD